MKEKNTPFLNKQKEKEKKKNKKMKKINEFVYFVGRSLSKSRKKLQIIWVPYDLMPFCEKKYATLSEIPEFPPIFH